MSQNVSLEQLAVARFGGLREAELSLVRAAAKGDTASCGPDADLCNPANSPLGSDGWEQSREINAELIRWVCSNQIAVACVDPRGLRICAAKISGALDLSNINIPFPVVLRQCKLIGNFNLDLAQIPELDLAGSQIEKMSAEYAHIKGCIIMNKGFYATGPIELTGIQILGNLECDGGRFENPRREGIETSGAAINGENSRISGDVLLREGFSAKGSVWLMGARIEGNLECWGSKFENPVAKNFEERFGAAESGTALNGEGVNVHGTVLLNDGFSAKGLVSFNDAQIGGDLNCDGAKIENPPRRGLSRAGTALTAINASVKGDVLFTGQFLARGAVNLGGAQIGGALDFEGGLFTNPARKGLEESGIALTAMKLKVADDINMEAPFSAKGAVILDGAQIGGDLDCEGGRFENPSQKGIVGSGVALTAAMARVSGDILLRDAFSATGEVNLDGAEIGGTFDCDGGRFDNAALEGIEDSGTALFARSIRVTDSVFLGDGFAAIGAVDLDGASIEGILECNSGKFENPHLQGNAKSGTAINARFVQVGDSVFLNDGFASKGGVNLHKAQIGGRLEIERGTFEGLNLVDASVGSIVDDEASWPSTGNLSLDGFVYERISGGPTDAGKRLDWLGRQGTFARQPYRQLAKVLRDAGDDEGLRRVCFEMEKSAWKLRRKSEFGKWEHSKVRGIYGGLTASIADFALRGIIGYGYRSFWALRWLLFVSVTWGLLYFVGFQVGSMVPTEEKNYAAFVKSRTLSPGYERFHVTVYTIENSFPLVKLGIEDKWGPSPDMQAASASSSGWATGAIRSFVSPSVLRWARWIQRSIGWILTTFFVAGITGLIRRD